MKNKSGKDHPSQVKKSRKSVPSCWKSDKPLRLRYICYPAYPNVTAVISIPYTTSYVCPLLIPHHLKYRILIRLLLQSANSRSRNRPPLVFNRGHVGQLNPMTLDLSFLFSSVEFLTQVETDAMRHFPSHTAFKMSVNAVFRLQDVYQLSARDLSNGHVGDHSTSARMSSDDCYQLGKVAYDNADYYHAVTWLTESLRLLNQQQQQEGHQTSERRVQIYQYLAESLFQVVFLNSAVSLFLCLPCNITRRTFSF